MNRLPKKPQEARGCGACLCVEGCLLRLLDNSASGKRAAEWPPPRRGGRANDKEGIGRMDGERSPRRGDSGSCASLPECVKFADDLGDDSSRTSRGLLPSTGDGIDPTEKKVENKATVETRNVGFDRRNSMANKGLSAPRRTSGGTPKPTSAVASCTSRRHESGALGRVARSKPIRRPQKRIIDGSLKDLVCCVRNG
jgi:hypothetical protein